MKGFALTEATLSSKGQATIPKAVRQRLHLKPGDWFKFFFHPDGRDHPAQNPNLKAERDRPEAGQASVLGANRSRH